MYHYHIACCSCQSKLKDTLLTCYSRYDHVTSFKHNLAGKEMLYVHRCPFFISQLHGIFSYDIYIYIKFLKSEANSTGGFVHNFHPLRHLNLNLISPRCIVFFSSLCLVYAPRCIDFYFLPQKYYFFFAQSSQTVIKCWTKISGAL